MMDKEGPAATGESLLRELPLSPDAYVQNVDFARQSALIVLLDAGSYRAASFLDDRVLAPGMRGAWLPFERVAEASLQARSRCPLHFIFHTGHVGSTLLTRLFEDAADVLLLREPLPLRALAQAHDALGQVDSLLSPQEFDAALGTFLRLWSRGYSGTQAVVVKATSTAGRIAAPVLDADAASRAIYMNLRAEPYLATLLAGQNSPIDLRGHGPERMRRLQSRSTQPLPPLSGLSLGELAAMSWLCETSTQREAAERFPDRVMALDFDDFLANVGDAMVRVLAHLGLPHNDKIVSAIERSASLTRYSKAPEYEYSAGIRAEILREARRDHREEIRKGIAWLENRARSDPGLARIVSGASGGTRVST
jgi:hypothetical protein